MQTNIMRYSNGLGWWGMTKDGRKVTVDPDQLEEDTDCPSLMPDEWVTLVGVSPAVRVYCGLCGDDSQDDDSDNTGGEPCTCECHVDGIARSAQT